MAKARTLAVEIDLFTRSPDENSGMRRDDLNTGGVRIVTFPLTAQRTGLACLTRHHDPDQEAVTLKSRAIHAHQLNCCTWQDVVLEKMKGGVLFGLSTEGQNTAKKAIFHRFLFLRTLCWAAYAYSYTVYAKVVI